MLGRPNVGKSSLLNKLAGQERVLVDAEAGTTRDPVDELIELGGNVWRFVDTAGIRRRIHQTQGADYFAAMRTERALERASEHPVARAIAAEAERRLGDLPAADSFVALPGVGASGVVEGHEIYVGRAGGALRALTPGLSDRCAEWEGLGRTVVVVRRDRDVIGAFAVNDVIRPSAAPAVRRFHHFDNEACGSRSIARVRRPTRRSRRPTRPRRR